MKKPAPISEELIAPCGMNCAICSRYLSYVNGLKQSQCMGCKPRDKSCEYLFGKYTGINHTAKGNASFCFECNQYPCKQIDRIDNRYRNNYKMSVKDNLGLISVHNRKCFKCDTITRLIDKKNN
jgi:hypothetical protein